MELIYLFLPMMVFLGTITNFEDIKEGKIRNKYIIAALGYAAIVYLFIVGYLSLTNQPINIDYFKEFFITFIIVVIMSFVLWYIDFWSSGDAKLFIAFVALIPLSIYQFGYVKFISPVIILINTFVPLTIFYGLKILTQTTSKEKRNIFEQLKNKKLLGIYVLFIFVISWVPVLLSKVSIEIHIILIIIIIFFFARSLNTVFGKNVFWVLAGLALIRLITDKTIVTFAFAKQMLFLFLILLLCKAFFLGLPYILNKKTKTIPFAPYLSGGVATTLFLKADMIFASFHASFFLNQFLENWLLIVVFLGWFATALLLVYLLKSQRLYRIIR